MKEDFLQSLKFIGFTARMKRLSDNLMYDAKMVYANSELDIEPNWHLIFLLLKQEKELSVTEIARILGFSHPAIIKITKKMHSTGYIVSTPSPVDNRKTLLRLSDKAIQALPMFEKNWQIIKSIVEEMVDETFLNQLTEIENQLQDKTLTDRFIQEKTKNE